MARQRQSLMEMPKDRNNTDDLDANTDAEIYRDSRTYSKGYLKRHKLLSMIMGNPQPSRKKIFSEIRITEDLKLFTMEVQGKVIYCAKIYNPALLLVKTGHSTWDELHNIQRLEIEDHEGILSTVPKQLVTELRILESLTITWTKIRSLPDRLFQLPLNSLYLQRNQLRSLTGIEQAADTLTILDVSNNCIDSLPKMFGQLRKLITLNVSGNALRELPDGIGSLACLRSLDVSSNRLRSLPATIGNIIELTSLDVCSNQLTELPDSLAGLPNLEDLRARGNRLAKLPSAFGRLARLNSLLLRGNQFVEVPPVLAELTKLTNLNMRDNSIEQMPRPIRSLRVLVLDHNRLTAIDAGILGCVNLQMLSLQNNQLSVIPADISRLAALRSLLLAYNTDIAVVPVELSRLTNLRNLSLRATRIKTVPLDVAQIATLSTIDLDECTELNHYLKLAHKDHGLAGLVQQLLDDGEGSMTESTSGLATVDADDELIRTPPSGASMPIVDLTNRQTYIPKGQAVGDGGQSRQLQNINAHMTMLPRADVDQSSAGQKQIVKPDACRQTMMPLDDEDDDSSTAMLQLGGGSTSRHEAGLSIVLGKTTLTDDRKHTAKPPIAPKNVDHVARQTMYPSESVEMVAVGRGGGGGSVDEEGVVVYSFDNFGDLVSSTNIDAKDDTSALYAVVSKTKPPPVTAKPISVGSRSPPAAAAAAADGEDGDDEDGMSALYARVTKKSSKPSVRFAEGY